MIEIIETKAYGPAGKLGKREATLLSAFGRLRKQRFHDELGWEVRVERGEERDVYDDEPAIYVLAVRDERVTGGLRLMSTMGRTLLHDVFGVLMDDPADHVAPDLWEITRFCLAPASPRDKAAVTRALFAGLLDVSRERGIRRHVAVTDPSVRRLLRFSGLDAVEFSHDDESFGCPVTLFGWNVDGGFAATIGRECVLHGLRALVTAPELSPLAAIPLPANANDAPTVERPAERAGTRVATRAGEGAVA